MVDSALTVLGKLVQTFTGALVGDKLCLAMSCCCFCRFGETGVLRCTWYALRTIVLQAWCANF